MKLKLLTFCALSAVISACTDDSVTGGENNTAGSITIAGTPLEGQTLTANLTDSDGVEESTLTYQWLSDGDFISGATGSSYVLTGNEVGDPVSVQAIYTDGAGFTEAPVSDETDDIQAINFAGSVTVTGTAEVGETLTATVSDDNGVSGNITYMWLAGDTAITNATDSTYVLTTAETGSEIKVVATYTDDAGYSESVTSAATSVVVLLNTEGTVTISGTPVVGTDLTAVVADGDGTVNATIVYQWLADGSAITGQTANIYSVVVAELGKTISVQVIYTDDNGFAEDNTSAATAAVSTTAVDVSGSVTISGAVPFLVGNDLTATVTDNNGFTEANATFLWKADGVGITNSNTAAYTLTAAEAGAVLSVEVSYMDDDGFSAVVTDATATRVYSSVVDSAATLSAALGAAVDGAWIGLNTGAYVNLADIELASNVSLAAVEGQTPVISGELCIHMTSSNTGSTIMGITFDDLNWTSDTGSSCFPEEASIYSEGDNVVITGNHFSEVTAVNGSEYNWLVMKGADALIERNTFDGKDSSKKGGFIKLTSSSSGHKVQYNLFKNFTTSGSINSSSYALNVGSTTGTDANLDAGFIVQYNRFENMLNGRRLMRVQTSGATIHGNTILDSYGSISLEDGQNNTVSNNVIIRSTWADPAAKRDDLASGILLHVFGHTVTGNYIAGMHSDDKTLGGIIFSVNQLSAGSGDLPNAGHQALIDAGLAGYSTTVTGNTVLNSEQSIVFSTSWDGPGDCDDIATPTITDNTFRLTFDSNLVMNGLNTNAAREGGYLDAAENPSDHSFEYDCDLIDHVNSSFTNNSGFSDSYVSGDESGLWVDIRNLNGNGEFDTDGAIDQDQAGNGKEIAEFVTGNDGLIEADPAGAQTGRGADVDSLNYIEENEVGAGSTWEASAL